MEECFLDLILFLNYRQIFFLVVLGEGADVFQQLKLEYLDKVKAFNLCNHIK